MIIVKRFLGDQSAATATPRAVYPKDDDAFEFHQQFASEKTERYFAEGDVVLTELN